MGSKFGFLYVLASRGTVEQVRPYRVLTLRLGLDFAPHSCVNGYMTLDRCENRKRIGGASIAPKSGCESEVAEKCNRGVRA